MKKYALWFSLGVIIIACAGFVETRLNNIFLLNTNDDEIKIRVRAAASQTAPFLEFVKGGSNVFSVAADGTITPPLATLGGFGTSAYSNSTAFMKAAVATTNSYGDVTIEGTTAWLQMIGDGLGTGQRIVRFRNGVDGFALQRANDANNFQTTYFNVTNDVWTFGVPTVSPQAHFTTNTNPLVPDFTKGYQMFSTNNTVGFLAPVGVDLNLAQTCVVVVTNSTASVTNITVPVSIHEQGATFVTNVTMATFFHYGGLFTNVIFLPLY